MAEVPKDRRYTMSPEWKQAYNKLMKVYSEFEAHNAAKDVRRIRATKKEREDRFSLAKKRIARDRERYKTFSTKELKKLYRDWHLADYADDRAAKI